MKRKQRLKEILKANALYQIPAFILKIIRKNDNHKKKFS